MPWLSQLYRAAIVLAFLAIAACQSLPPPYVGTDRGYLVASIAAPRTSTTYRRYEFYFRPVEAPSDIKAFKWQKLDLLQQSTGDFQTEERIGFVGVASLPPGKYELFSFVAWNNSSPSSAFSPRGGVSIPFTIATGETAYLGEFFSVATWGENIFGMTLASMPYFVHSNKNSERDLSIAKVKEPALPAAARNAIANPDALGTPFVRSSLRRSN